MRRSRGSGNSIPTLFWFRFLGFFLGGQGLGFRVSGHVDYVDGSSKYAALIARCSDPILKTNAGVSRTAGLGLRFWVQGSGFWVQDLWLRTSDSILVYYTILYYTMATNNPLTLGPKA